MKFKIKEVMQVKGFNNSKLADTLGVTRGTITNNLKNPSLETLEKIASTIGVKVRDLLDEGEDEELQPIYTKDENGKEMMIGYLLPKK